MKSDDILRRTQELLGSKAAEKEAAKAQLENERRLLVTSLGKEIAQIIAPALQNMMEANQVTVDSIRQMLKEIRVEVPPLPEVKLPPINVPRPVVNVAAPEVKVPPINVPEAKIHFPERMSVTMDSVDNKRPLPVMMMGTDGKPMPFSMGAGGGGKADFLTIKDIRTSTGASIINDAGQLKTDAGTPTLSLDYGSGEIGGVTARVVMATDAVASVNVVSGSTSGTEYTDATNTELGDGGLIMARDAVGSIYGVRIGSGTSEVALRTVQATDAVSSVVVNSGTITTVTAVTGITNSVAAYQLDGDGSYRSTFPVEGTVAVSGITASVAANVVDSSGVAYSGSNPVPVSGTVVVSSVTASTASNIVDSSGVAYSGSNPVPVTVVTSSVASTSVVGIVASDVADAGSNPVKVGGIARQANPTAVDAGDMVSATYDDVGRQVMRPLQVRDLITTAYTSLTTGTETTLISGVASTYLDLVYVMCANQSDAATYVDFRCGTAGSVILTVEVPAEGTAGVSLAVPMPMPEAAQAWTADLPDITGTTVDITAMFSKEV